MVNEGTALSCSEIIIIIRKRENDLEGVPDASGGCNRLFSQKIKLIIPLLSMVTKNPPTMFVSKRRYTKMYK